MNQNQQIAAFIVAWIVGAICYFVGFLSADTDRWNAPQGLFAVFVIAGGGITSVILAGTLIYRACQL